jgi:septal ring factor EnvC (AmiA/AmiB activator)
VELIKRTVEKRLNEAKKHAAVIKDEINYHTNHLQILNRDLHELENEINELEQFLKNEK